MVAGTICLLHGLVYDREGLENTSRQRCMVLWYTALDPAFQVLQLQVLQQQNLTDFAVDALVHTLVFQVLQCHLLLADTIQSLQEKEVLVDIVAYRLISDLCWPLSKPVNGAWPTCQLSFRSQCLSGDKILLNTFERFQKGLV